MLKPESFLNDKIFEIQLDIDPDLETRSEGNNRLNRFRYVQLKINRTTEINLVKDMNDEKANSDGKYFIQIIDMSLNKLFDQFETEKVFISMLIRSMINRLKNPLQ